MLKTVRQIFFSLILVLHFLVLVKPYPTLAATCPPTWNCQGGCTYEGQCISNHVCVKATFPSGTILLPGPGGCGSAVVGSIVPPEGVKRYNLLAIHDGGNIGIMFFISNAIKLFAVVCGILVFGNFLYSGYLYITGAGNADSHTKVRERVTWSILGLVLLIMAYMLIALFSLLIFGDASFILNPDLTKYGALAP